MGYGSEAVICLIDYLFDQFALQRLKASVDPRNKASIVLLKKLGFQKTGFFPKSVEIRGELQDDAIYEVDPLALKRAI